MNINEIDKLRRDPFYADASKQLMAGKRIKIARFQFSKRCPYECAYCYRESRSRGDIVPYQTAVRITERLEGEGWKVFPMFAEIVDEIEEHFQLMKRHKSYEISTTGHPLLKRKEWFDILKSNNIDALRITVFPTDEIHARWTRQKRADVLTAIDLSLKKGFHVTWNFLLSRQTAPYLRGQIEEAVEAGANRLHINVFFPGGRGKDFAEEMLSEDELAKIKLEYERLKIEFKGVIALSRNGVMGPRENNNSTSAILSTRNRFCLAGSSEHGQMIFIDADLSVYGCMIQLGPDLRIGSMSKEGELTLNGKDPLAGYDRKDCYVRQYLRSRYSL